MISLVNKHDLMKILTAKDFYETLSTYLPNLTISIVFDDNL